jgi:hypothetical protein
MLNCTKNLCRKPDILQWTILISTNLKTEKGMYSDIKIKKGTPKTSKPTAGDRTLSAILLLIR